MLSLYAGTPLSFVGMVIGRVLLTSLALASEATRANGRLCAPQFMHMHPTCAFRGVEAQVVDHIKRHREDPALVLNWNNFIFVQAVP